MSAADREFVQRLGKFLVVGASGVVVNNAALFTLYQWTYGSGGVA
jgi:putative flippase GtrA